MKIKRPQYLRVTWSAERRYKSAAGSSPVSLESFPPDFSTAKVVTSRLAQVELVFELQLSPKVIFSMQSDCATTSSCSLP